MASTYELIASVTVGAGGASSISFSSIPATYTDLVVKLSLRNDATNDQIIMKANGSSSSLTSRVAYGSGSATGSASLTTGYAGTLEASSMTANTFGTAEVYLPNYAGSNNKSASVDSAQETNATAAYAALNAWLWSNTSAITSLVFTPDVGNFVQYSTAYLYGVKNV